MFHVRIWTMKKPLQLMTSPNEFSFEIRQMSFWVWFCDTISTQTKNHNQHLK